METKSSPRPPPDHLTREEWLEHRKHGIGASEVSSILGLNPWQSPYALWAKKTGKIDSETKDEAANPPIMFRAENSPRPGLIMRENVAVEQGHVQEPWLAEKYFLHTGRHLTDPGTYTIFRHPELSLLSCTLDRAILVEGQQWPKNPFPSWLFASEYLEAPLELKTTGEFNMAKWRDGDPPLENQVQLQTQIAILGSDWGSLCGLVGNRELFAFDVMRNEDFVDIMLTKVYDFSVLVNWDVPPEVDGMRSTREALAKMHPKDNGMTTLLLDKVCVSAHLLEVTKQEIKLLEERKAGAENALRAAIGDASFGEGADGEQLYSLRHQNRKGVYRVEMTPENKEALDVACVAYKTTAPSETRVLRKVKT